MKRNEPDPERAIALALLLEFMEGDTHTAAISEVFDRALNGPSFLFLYQQLLPVLAAHCGTDAKDFQKVVDRAVLQAFSSIGAETFEVLEENLPVFREMGYAPEELSLLKDIAPWLDETKWRRVFSAAESLVESNQDPKKMVSFLEAALSHPPTAERARLVARMETLLDGALDPHLRFKLLKIAYQVAEERKGHYAEQLVELSLEMGTASSAKEALKLCSAHLAADWRKDLLSHVERDAASIPILEEEIRLATLTHLSVPARQKVLSTLISKERPLLEAVDTELALYAITAQFDPAAADDVLLTLRNRFHFRACRDFFGSAAWLAWPQNDAALLETIEPNFLDKVDARALGEVFERISPRQRIAFLKRCFTYFEADFPPSVEALERPANRFRIAMLAGSDVGRFLVSKLPSLLRNLPASAWPAVLALLAKGRGESSDDLRDAIEAAAASVPLQYLCPDRCTCREAGRRFARQSCLIAASAASSTIGG